LETESRKLFLLKIGISLILASKCGSKTCRVQYLHTPWAAAAYEEEEPVKSVKTGHSTMGDIEKFTKWPP
jgi:hypothetical protein